MESQVGQSASDLPAIGRLRRMKPGLAVRGPPQRSERGVVAPLLGQADRLHHLAFRWSSLAMKLAKPLASA